LTIVSIEISIINSHLAVLSYGQTRHRMELETSPMSSALLKACTRHLQITLVIFEVIQKTKTINKKESSDSFSFRKKIEKFVTFHEISFIIYITVFDMRRKP